MDFAYFVFPQISERQWEKVILYSDNYQLFAEVRVNNCFNLDQTMSVDSKPQYMSLYFSQTDKNPAHEIQYQTGQYQGHIPSGV